MAKNVYAVGFVAFIVIMIAFFVTNIFFRDVNYYRTSIVLNAFLVPLVLAIGAFFSVTTYSRYKKEISFKEAFGRAFLPMFVGGLLSVLSIFIYISYVDKDTKDLLNYQYIESYQRSLEEEYSKANQITKPNSPEMQDLEKNYKEAKIRIKAKEDKKEDMFSLQYFAYVFAGFCAFFIILSVFFGSFFRTRRAE